MAVAVLWLGWGRLQRSRAYLTIQPGEVFTLPGAAGAVPQYFTVETTVSGEAATVFQPWPRTYGLARLGDVTRIPGRRIVRDRFGDYRLESTAR